MVGARIGRPPRSLSPSGPRACAGCGSGVVAGSAEDTACPGACRQRATHGGGNLKSVSDRDSGTRDSDTGCVTRAARHPGAADPRLGEAGGRRDCHQLRCQPPRPTDYQLVRAGPHWSKMLEGDKVSMRVCVSPIRNADPSSSQGHAMPPHAHARTPTLRHTHARSRGGWGGTDTGGLD